MGAEVARVLVLGASGYYCPAIASLIQAGCWVGVVDRDPGAPGLALAQAGAPVDIIDADGVERVARQWGVEAVVPVNDYGVPTAAEVARRLGLRGLSPRTAEICTDKYLMRVAWAEAGLSQPVFVFSADPDELRRAVARMGLPCILKPRESLGGGSRGVVVLREAAELEEGLRFALAYAQGRGVMVEEFVTGVEHSTEVYMREGRARLLAVGDKIKTPLPYRVDKDVIYPAALDAGQAERARLLAEAACRAVGLDHGIAHLEFCHNQRGFFLYEMGARPGGGHTSEVILPHLVGVHEFLLHTMCLLGRDQVPPPPAEPRAAVYHFLTPAPGVFAGVEGLDWAAAHPQVLDVGVFLRPGQEIKPVRIGPERAGFVVTRGRDSQEALAAAREVEAGLRFRYR